MVQTAPAARLKQFFRISRLLAGQLEFRAAIQAVADEVATIVPHDHLDVCILHGDGRFHTAYETGLDTDWGRLMSAPVAQSPIRALLIGEVGHILTADATTDPRFVPTGPAHAPIFDHGLRSRLHVPMVVHGQIIGALSCSLRTADAYGDDDLRNARYIAELLSPYFFALRAAEQARQSSVIEAEARAREEGLRQGALRLTEALEQERQRIGMDLHDQTLADLTRIARRLDRLAATPGLTPGDLAPLQASLQQSMQALRQIIEAARPSVLELFGLAHAVENHLDQAIRDSGQPIAARLTDDSGGAFDALPATVGVALFRVVQEAINNAVHHAQARRIAVTLGRGRRSLVISVVDDGRGLPRGARRGGSGIDNMRTRARLIAARFTIAAGADGTGTRVSVVLPAGAHAPAEPLQAAS